MVDKRKSLEQLTEEQQSQIQAKLPLGYLISQYFNDMNDLHGQIDTLIGEGKEYVKKQQYDIAGTTFTDVGDLQDIYMALSEGDLPYAVRMVDNLDTAVRDHIPTRLYDQLYRI